MSVEDPGFGEVMLPAPVITPNAILSRAIGHVDRPRIGLPETQRRPWMLSFVKRHPPAVKLPAIPTSC